MMPPVLSSQASSSPAGKGIRRSRYTPFAVCLTSTLAFQLGLMASYYRGNIPYWANDGTTALQDSPQQQLRQHKATGDEDDFALALHESGGFFQDIPTTEWLRLKSKVTAVYPNTLTGTPPSELRNKPMNANRFFQDHFEPDFNCRHERRIGKLGDGGKWVCDPHLLKVGEEGRDGSTIPPCLVYSVGSNGDSSFEAAVKKEIGSHCDIHTFDMRNYRDAVEGVGAHFHQWGIAAQSTTDRRGGVYKTLQETVEELGHVGRTIDVFKIDCEGCEWSTYPSFFTAGVELRQILIELHSRTDPKNPKGKFQPMPQPQSMDFFDAMYHHGYVIFHKEVNIKFWHYGQCTEYAFLKLHPDFFSDIPELAGETAVSK